MVTSPVLTLLDFTKAFVVEMDACSKRLGVVLIQDFRPIAFLSKALSLKQQTQSIYEREFVAILLADRKWKHYLQGNHFILKTDKRCLKDIMEPKTATALQQRWIAKLIGLDCEIHYKQGVENKVPDALSRRDDIDNTLHPLIVTSS